MSLKHKEKINQIVNTINKSEVTKKFKIKKKVIELIPMMNQ